MNCAATLHLHAGAFLNTFSPSHPDCSGTSILTHARTHTCTNFCVKDTRCKSHSSPLPHSQVITLLCTHSLCLFDRCILVFRLLLRGGHLTHNPLPCWHELGHKQSIMGTCSAWWPECAHFCSKIHCLPFCTLSGPGRTTCSPSPTPRTERRLLCSNILIINLKSVAVVVLQSKSLTGGEEEGESERVSKGESKGRLETVLFLYWFESWLPLTAPQ